MLLWFVGVGFLAVVFTFRSPALDYRLVAAGSVLPLIDLAPGVPPLLHTLLGAVVVLAVTMLATIGRRLARRRWLGLPIGIFVHLVLDATWSSTALFWWPAFGLDLPEVSLPTLGSGPLGIVLELVGTAAIWWSWRRFGLDHPARRQALLRDGRLDRELVP